MKIPKKMIEDKVPEIKTVSYQTGFAESAWGCSYIYYNNHAAHVSLRVLKSDGFMQSGEVIVNVGEAFRPVTTLNGQTNRYLNGYALADDNLSTLIGDVLLKVETTGLVGVYFPAELTGKIKSIVVPEQQYLL